MPAKKEYKMSDEFFHRIRELFVEASSRRETARVLLKNATKYYSKKGYDHIVSLAQEHHKASFMIEHDAWELVGREFNIELSCGWSIDWVSRKVSKKKKD